MFLVGVFGNYDKLVLSESTLDNAVDILVDLPSSDNIVMDYLYELVVGAFGKGVTFSSRKEAERYAFSIRRNALLSEYKAKVRHKEYSIVDPDDDGRVGFMGINSQSISDDLSLVEKPTQSWSNIVSGLSLRSLDVRDTLVEYIDDFNTTFEYLEATYGFDLKEILRNISKGVSESLAYFKSILELEGDTYFSFLLGELSSYDEFYEYLGSDVRLLSLGGGSDVI